jgi:hypothetical protein
MAARTPVIALDGPGVRDVISDANGLLLPADTPLETYAAALAEMTSDPEALAQLGESARRSARGLSVEACVDRLLALYGELVQRSSFREGIDPVPWDRLLRRLEIEWNLLVEKATALGAAVVETEVTKSQAP